MCRLSRTVFLAYKFYVLYFETHDETLTKMFNATLFTQHSMYAFYCIHQASVSKKFVEQNTANEVNSKFD